MTAPAAAPPSFPELAADTLAVTAGVNELIREALRPATLISALVLSIFAVTHFLNLPAPANARMAAFTALSAVACFGLRFHLVWRPPALSRMNRWSAGLAGLIGLNSWMMLYLRRQPDETVTLMLIMIGAGFLLPSHRWFSAVVITIVLSWAGVAGQAGWGPLWVNYGFTLLIGTAVAGLLHVVWTRTLRRMVGLRLKLEKRQEELAHSEARFRQLTEAAAEGVVIHAGGRVRDANPAFVRMVGRPLADLLGQSIFDLVAPEWLTVVEQQVRSGSEQLYEAALVRPDGSQLPVEIMGRPATYRGEPARVAIVHDLTARRQADAARQQAEEQLRRWAQELRERNQAMDLLAEMGEMLQAANTLEQAQAIIAHYAGQLFPECSGALYLLRASRNLLEVGVSWGPAPPPEPDFTPEACWALRRSRPHRAVQPAGSLVCAHVHPPADAPYACLPLTAQGEALGILHLRGPISAEREPLTTTVAEQAALALLNLRLRETLRNQAIRDPLTGLFNRRFLEETLERELKRAERTSRPVGLLMLDLDHFKRLNDSFGHDAGDYVLREVAHHLEASFRGGDVICRYGGEEFTVLLPEASLEHIQQRADLVCAGIRELTLEYRGRPLGPLTVSIGVAASPLHGAAASTLLRGADAALYAAKRSGRDRVMVATTATELA